MDIDLTDRRLYHNAFCQQRRQAAGRGISFELTFEQWLAIWVESGRLHLRGRRRGQYVMARFGDHGSYAVGNVRIITSSKNNREKRMSMEARSKISAAKTGNKCFRGHAHSRATREKMSEAHRGHKHGAATLVKMSKSQRKRRRMERGC